MYDIGTNNGDKINQRYLDLRKLLPVPSTPISLKCKFKSEVRRVTVHTVPTYDELLFLVHRLFRPAISGDLNNLVLKYVDEDYDLVSITDDLDINHAIALSPNLKVIVFDEKNPFSEYKPTSEKVSVMEEVSLKQDIALLSSKLESLLTLVEKKAGEKSNFAAKPLTFDLEEFVGKSNGQKGNDPSTSVPATPEVSVKPASSHPTVQPPQVAPQGIQPYHSNNVPYPSNRYHQPSQQYNAHSATSQPPQQYSNYPQATPSHYAPASSYPHHMPQGANAYHAQSYPASMAQHPHASYYPSAPGAHYP